MSQVHDPHGADPVGGEPATELTRPVGKTKRGSSVLNVALGVAVLLAVAGIAFAAGRMLTPATAAFPNGGPVGGFQGRPGASPGPGGGGFQPGGGLLGGGGVTIEGTVEARSGDTLTIRTADGQTVEITLPADTTYHAQAPATSDEVQSGVDVRVRVDFQPGQGTGQITADDVTIVP
jgi:hypothetical protein